MHRTPNKRARGGSAHQQETTTTTKIQCVSIGVSRSTSLGGQPVAPSKRAQRVQPPVGPPYSREELEAATQLLLKRWGVRRAKTQGDSYTGLVRVCATDGVTIKHEDVEHTVRSDWARVLRVSSR